MRVRSGETPRSPVVKPPCVVERPGSKRGGATDQSVTSREACSVVTPVRRETDEEEPSPFPKGEGHGRHQRSWSGCPGTSRRRGLGMARRLSSELERSSSAPDLRSGKQSLSITGDPGKCQAAERKSEGAVVVMMDRTTQPVRSEGPLLHRCTTKMWRNPDECRTLG